jgi:hypothetical protein
MVYIYMAIKILLDHSNELYYYIIRTNVLWGFVTIKRIGLIKNGGFIHEYQ